ncbi:hypothetical protein CTA2_5859 [Colletotrichum tanaceti]|uniref:DJ-1/PfpI domain-containing protein n=1 Tax=Colletotrichum tanaceti TaxID=1306861 RepID=A0A4V6Y9M4_9PEZI|nr:hypothetical protein CTA2_5859 [Colletotrichum tanaceti]TKW60206.1 hypothetical protein CTA1_4782 [Colletotrichum tanaceti]
MLGRWATLTAPSLVPSHVTISAPSNSPSLSPRSLTRPASRTPKLICPPPPSSSQRLQCPTYQAFKVAGFHVNFATETGKTPRCDSRMLEGLYQKLLPPSRPRRKVVFAICHGPLLLCNTKGDDGNSRHQAVKVVYKMYGAGSENVEAWMRKGVKDPSHFESSRIPHQPFVSPASWEGEKADLLLTLALFLTWSYRVQLRQRSVSPPDAAKMTDMMMVNLIHLVQASMGQDESVGL